MQLTKPNKLSEKHLLQTAVEQKLMGDANLRLNIKKMYRKLQSLATSAFHIFEMSNQVEAKNNKLFLQREDGLLTPWWNHSSWKVDQGERN